jgi:hypothetical protein
MYDRALVILMNAALVSHFPLVPTMSSWKFTLCLFFYYSPYICSRKKVCRAAPKKRKRGKVLFSVYSTFPGPEKNGWNEKHKQIPKKAMKLNLNHQMSGTLEHLPLYYTVILIYFLCCLGERRKIARAKMKTPTQKCTATLNISRWLHNLFVLNIMFMGWKTSPFFFKEWRVELRNFVTVVGEIFMYFGVSFVVG